MAIDIVVVEIQWFYFVMLSRKTMRQKGVEWRYNDFSLSIDLTRRPDQSVMWFYGQEPIKVSYDPVKFGGALVVEM